MSSYTNLFQPLKVNSITLKNRIIAAPMSGGFIGRNMVEYVGAKARGGAALIILGSSNVDNDRSLIAPGWPGLYDPHLESYTELLNTIHQYGAKASIELFHAGLWAYLGETDKHPLGPVDMIRDIGKDADGVTIDAMTEEDMNTVADSFATAAIRAKRLGFDMCMLHFAHGWLAAQFLSPKYNKRTDNYGGSFENRIRFPMMIVDRVRKAVGPDYPLDMRISGDERCSDGIDPDEVIQFILRIEDKIDMIHVSSGIDKYFDLTTYVEPPQLYPHAINVHLAEAMKKAVKIPVVTVGAITMPDEAEAIIKEGKADCIAMARALLADPEWPNKAKTDRSHEIVPCLRCNSCYHVATESFSLGCSVNPVFGRETRVKLDKLSSKGGKHVVIVGGGPAGMKAAITAAEYGHKVTLFEKSGHLGGMINISEYDDKKADLRNYRRYLVHNTLSSNITVHLHREATPEMVKALNPDEVIIAIGAEPATPPIKGIDTQIAIQAIDVLKNIYQLPQKNVIIGGGEVGCELALKLAEAGKEAVIIEMSSTLAPASNLLYRAALEILINQQTNISYELETICTEIKKTGVDVKSKDGTQAFISADCIVLAAGMKPLTSIAEQFYSISDKVTLIGDCVTPRKVGDATYEAFHAITSIS